MTVQRLSGVYTVREVAELVGVSPATIRKEVHAGRLRAKWICSCWRILSDDVDAWLRSDE